MDGRFEGFMPATGCRGDALTILSNLMRRFFTQAQKDKMQRMLPTEYSSLAMDAEGFLYTTSATTKDKTASIKKLSALRHQYPALTAGRFPMGIRGPPWSADRRLKPVHRSLWTATALSALDTQRGKVSSTTRKATSLRCSAAWGSERHLFRAGGEWIT